VAQGREETAEPSVATGDVARAGRAERGSEAAAPGRQKADRAPGGDPPGALTSAGGGPAWADLDFVRGLIEVVDASGIDSLEITRSGTRIKISKTPPAVQGPAFYAQAPYPAALAPGAPGASGPGAAAGSGVGGNAATAAAEAGAPGTKAAAAPGLGETGGGVGEEAGLVEVKSPMVGTFYRAPAPEAPPYVEVGTRVSKGQTLCILEAMKLMNELESEVEGVVRQVLVENAEPVEYGQVLYRIDPNG
jgi:acetyl-CoA carboxylase biotin carboxyl carrier protein